MKVTVLMTLYDKGPFVEEAVRSVLEQTFARFELLVVDDRSSDDGPDRVRAIDDPRIRVIVTPENLGRAGAANYGFAAACGEYVAILDADDVMMPSRLAKQVAFLDEHPDVGVVGSWLNALGQERDKPLRFRTDDTAARALILFGTPVSYGASMIRRSVMLTHAVQCDPAWRYPGMDYLFLLALGRHARYANIQESLTSYRIGDQNMRHERDAMADATVILRRVFADLGVPATDEQVLLHRYFFDVLPTPADASTVRALWRWRTALLAWNQRSGLIPQDAFEASFRLRWDRLFYFFSDQGLMPGILHLWYGGRWSVAKLRYLLATCVRRFRGRGVRSAAVVG
ncbi:MAG: glycosyltransferase family 2 protein [Flavobacteriales bacterium]|nr:glycosyltransferase family 2 protein [Flavobacteriales bacterium]